MKKDCTKCGVSQSLDKFGKHKNGKFGRNSECKKCQAIREKKYKDSHKKQISEYNLKWNEANREYTREYAKSYSKQRYQTDPIYRFKANMRSHINVRLKNYLKNKKGKTLDYIGCNWETYIDHLESQFTDKMNWENYGDVWEVDHILPISKGGTFHYTNTQPLTITENRQKYNKLPF